MDLRFRRLTHDDLPMMHRWLNDPEIMEWWEGDDVSWAGVLSDYRPDPGGTLEHWIVEMRDRPIGWIQCYDFHQERGDDTTPAGIRVHSRAAGLDFLIGERADRGRGLGSQMLSEFVDQVLFGRHDQWAQAVADPHVDNVASRKALTNAGFHELGVIEDRWMLMARDRGE